ncbi:hypothetical protein [Zavarzinia sp.]|jgi:hypothetical protein|uniref:hypothetical protein n=1 Tax=Zavarzinia sp. TaxID=2027920 RepID=UPI003564867B
MTTTDDHARALGMVRLTMDAPDHGLDGPWYVRPDDVAAVADVAGQANVRCRGVATGMPVRESAAEVLRLLAEAKGHGAYLDTGDPRPALADAAAALHAGRFTEAGDRIGDALDAVRGTLVRPADPARALLIRAAAKVATLSEHCDLHDFGTSARAFDDIRSALRVAGLDALALADEWEADHAV